MDKQGFETTAKKLVEMFRKNIVKFEANVDGAVEAEQPGKLEAAARSATLIGVWLMALSQR